MAVGSYPTVNMKKIFLVLGIVYSTGLFACDMCASGGSANYIGIVPNFSKNLTGLRLQIQNSKFLTSNLNTNGNSAILEDNYYRTDWWFRLFASSGWQILGFVPYQVHQRTETLRQTEIQGVGDIAIYTNFTLINTGDSVNAKNKHTWMIGGGIKLPTGKYQQRDETKAMLPALFQIGSGSYGFSVNNNYSYRYKSFGINTQIQYNYLMENELGFQLGQQLTGGLSLYFWTKKERFSALPNLGIIADYLQANRNFGIVDANTGGNNLLLNIGSDFYYLNWVLQLSAYKSVASNFAAAMPQNNWRFGFGVAYILPK